MASRDKERKRERERGRGEREERREEKRREGGQGLVGSKQLALNPGHTAGNLRAKYLGCPLPREETQEIHY